MKVAPDVVGKIRISCPEVAPVPVDAMLGDSPVLLQGGDAIVEEFQRLRRVSAIDYQGQTLYRLPVTIVLDGYREDTSVEADLSILRAMARPKKGGVRLPVVNLSGPIPGTSIDWWLEAMTEMDLVERSDSGAVRIRQGVELQFVQYVAVDIALISRNKTKPGAFKLVKLKRGQTMLTLAKIHLKNTKRWKEIAALNKLRGPRFPAKWVGRNVKVPKR